jgi:type I restriction enzyme, S subunit
MIEQADLHKLPSSWSWVKLNNACQYIPTGVTDFNGKIDYYSTGSINSFTYVPEATFAFKERPSRANRISKIGDIFQARMAGTNKALLINEDLSNKLFSTGFLQLRPFSCCQEMSSFVYYYLQSSNFLRQRDGLATGSTQVALTNSAAENLDFPLAPLREQLRIVAKIEELFTRLDDSVETLKKIQLQLKQYKQSVLKSAFEGKLTAEWRGAHKSELEPASVLMEKIQAERRKSGKYKELPTLDTKDLPELPETWEWLQAEGLCHFITKGTTPKPNELFSEQGEIPFIKVYNLTDSGLLDFSVKPTFVSRDTHYHKLARSKIFPGDVLMNIVGPPLGKVSIVPNFFPEWNTNQAVAIFRPLIGYNNKFLSFALLNHSVLSWAKKRAKATAGQFNLTLEICRDLPLPLLSLNEQMKIVEKIERCFSVADEIERTVEQSLKQSERLKQSILKRAFEGKLVPQNPADEPADKLLERIKAERTKMNMKQGKTAYGK